ncbi:hypothetical protein [Streptomyces sp. 6-11-2]|uniref:hypothetical protein n=1 Tax=Streptomyces sp. 6-11-2 TaxID=2585753 RepID=UPI001143A63E|nr:hypothetical protein TNCT6_29740 [Streptomyces sp. 6-11-2]
MTVGGGPTGAGPCFKPNSPPHTALVTPGTPADRHGHVFGHICVPLSGVPLGSWQADDVDAHGIGGYALRGSQFTDSAGAYAPSKIVPGLHPGRTRHLHVKAQAPGRPALTTRPY